jgi:hypothetical protein
MEFFHFDLGNILTMVSFLIGGIYFVATIKNDVRSSSTRLENVERELFELRKVVVDLARQEERMNSMDQRMLAQGVRMDQLIARIDRLNNAT